MLPVQVAAESKMTVDVEEYVSSFRTDLCDVLAAWSRGSKFAEIMKMTDVFEVRYSCMSICSSCCYVWLIVYIVAAALELFPSKWHTIWRSACTERLDTSSVVSIAALSSRVIEQGSLVRAVRRVEEVLRQATAGAKVMGEMELAALFEDGITRIKRDIVFAASLYL